MPASSEADEIRHLEEVEQENDRRDRFYVFGKNIGKNPPPRLTKGAPLCTRCPTLVENEKALWTNAPGKGHRSAPE